MTINLLDLDKNTMGTLFDDKPYRAAQIFNWVYGKGVREIQAMTNIPKDMREKISSMAAIVYPEVIDRKTSIDGTEKLAYRLGDGNIIESVLIPEKDHWSICISSQVGCSMGCTFCYTATMGFVRNLTQAEIVSQVLYPIHTLPDRKIRNVVFMGMGEPLLNYDNVIRAIRIISDTEGPKLSTRRITVSTCGILPRLKPLWRDTKAGLAVSLNAATDEQRVRIMPITRAYPLTDLIKTLRAYQLPNRRRITIEYVLIKGINDRIADARELIRILHGLRIKVNLIPFNPWPGCTFEAPDSAVVQEFEDQLKESPIAVMLRKEKGNDILAACGQLAGGVRNVRQEAC